MNELFLVFLSHTVSGSFLILILLFCKPFLKNHLSKRWQYYIWLVVIARLLIPFAMETNIVGNLFQELNMGIEQMAVNTYSKSEINAAIESNPQTSNISSDPIPNSATNVTEKITTAQEENILLILEQYLWIFWLAVALMLLIRKITLYQSFEKYVRAGCLEVTDIDLLERFGKIIDAAKIRTNVELYTNSLVSSPILIGFWKPCIVLPTANLSVSDFQFTILHELTHYKRLDMFYKWLTQITICLHWFNPAVYLMGREINRLCELSCDEAVIRKLDVIEKRAYGDTLLNAIGGGGNYKNSLASVTLNESKQLLKERLDAILIFKEKSKLIIAITCIISILFSIGAMAAGAYAVQTPAQTKLYTDQKGDTGRLPDIVRDNTQEIDITLDIYNGGAEIIPVSSDKITAEYDNHYYDVRIMEKNGECTVSVSGKEAQMGKTEYVKLLVPSVKSNMNVQVLDGDFCYNLPENCADVLNITAQDCGIHFGSKNKYQNGNISITAMDKEFMEYSQITCPDYFTTTDNKITYLNGTGNNQISVLLTGYTNIDFAE